MSNFTKEFKDDPEKHPSDTSMATADAKTPTGSEQHPSIPAYMQLQQAVPESSAAHAPSPTTAIPLAEADKRSATPAPAAAIPLTATFDAEANSADSSSQNVLVSETPLNNESDAPATAQTESSTPVMNSNGWDVLASASPQTADAHDTTPQDDSVTPTEQSQASPREASVSPSPDGNAPPVIAVPATSQKNAQAHSAETKKRSFFSRGTDKKVSTTQPAVSSSSAQDDGKRPSYFKTHPVLVAEQTMPHSFLSRLYSVFAASPVLTLMLLLVLQTIFTLDTRDLWYSDEIRHGNAFQNLLDGGKWLVLELNGEPYPDKPPLYFWFLRALFEIVRTDGPFLYFTAAAVSALLFLWASLTLGRLVARVDKRTNLAAGILLLTSGYMLGVVHYARMDLLFAATILCSNICFYFGALSTRRFSPGILLGFVLAGVATLIKGPLGLALPLVAFLVFILWRGNLKRLFRLDILLGLFLFLAIIGTWLGAVYVEKGEEYLIGSVFKQQIFDRAVDTFHHKAPWSYYLVRLPLMCLPWTLVLFVLPWRSLFTKAPWVALTSSNRAEAGGIAYLWCIFLSGLILVSCLSGKIHIYLLPLLPVLALLAARVVLQLGTLRAATFRHSLAIFLAIGGIALVGVTLILFGHNFLPEIKGVPQWVLQENMFAFFLVAVIILLTPAALWFILKTSRPEGILLVMAFAATILAYPLWGMVAPSFNDVLSPKHQALLLRAYMDKGYTAVSYKTYGGTYSYYAHAVIKEADSYAEIENLIASAQALQAADTDAATPQGIVLATRRGTLNKWENKPPCLAEIHSQWIESNEHVVLACPPIADLAPAVPQYKAAPNLWTVAVGFYHSLFGDADASAVRGNGTGASFLRPDDPAPEASMTDDPATQDAEQAPPAAADHGQTDALPVPGASGGTGTNAPQPSVSSSTPRETTQNRTDDSDSSTAPASSTATNATITPEQPGGDASPVVPAEVSADAPVASAPPAGSHVQSPDAASSSEPAETSQTPEFTAVPSDAGTPPVDSLQENMPVNTPASEQPTAPLQDVSKNDSLRDFSILAV